MTTIVDSPAGKLQADDTTAARAATLMQSFLPATQAVRMAATLSRGDVVRCGRSMDSAPSAAMPSVGRHPTGAVAGRTSSLCPLPVRKASDSAGFGFTRPRRKPPEITHCGGPLHGDGD